MTEEVEPVETRSPPAGRGSHGSGVDARHTVRLRGEVARNLSDAMGRATREGLKLGKAARPGDVFELVPPPELAKGVANGQLRAATPKRGDASVLIKNAKDGQIVGKADLMRVKPTPLDVLGPAAWQAMALATQQHYLAEIDERLEGIQAGVDEVLARMDDDRIGTLNHISDVAAKASLRLTTTGELSERRLDELQEEARRAGELWHQVKTTAQRKVEDYAAGKGKPGDAERDFAMLAHATRVLTQCSEVLLAVPRASRAELESAYQDEEDRLYPALPEFRDVCEGLLSASESWREKHQRYEAARPDNRLVRKLKLPAVKAGSAPGGFRVEVALKPRQAPLSETTVEQLRGLTNNAIEGPERLVAEIASDGVVLLGPSPETGIQRDS